MGKDEEEGARLLVVPTTGKEEVTKIKNHEIPSEHKETLFSCGVDKNQQRLLKEDEEPLSLVRDHQTLSGHSPGRLALADAV